VAVTSFTAPHLGHGARCSAPPQALQNFASGGAGFSQNGQMMGDMVGLAGRSHCSSVGNLTKPGVPELVRVFTLLLAFALPAPAQEQEIQRALIERDQRTAEFAARVQGVPLVELQRLENLAARQPRDVKPEQPAELRPYERQKAAGEFVLRLPAPVARAEEPETARVASETVREAMRERQACPRRTNFVLPAYHGDAACLYWPSRYR